MAKLADILSIERDRQEPEKWGVIHLFKTGSFYTAYEWSAWLTAVVSFNDEVRKQTKSSMPLTVTRNEIASSENETFCKIDLHDGKRVSSTVNSYLGILSHTASFNLRQELFGGDDLARIIEIDTDYCKSKPQTRFCA